MKCIKCGKEIKIELILNDVLGKCGNCDVEYENGVFKKWNNDKNEWEYFTN